MAMVMAEEVGCIRMWGVTVSVSAALCVLPPASIASTLMFLFRILAECAQSVLTAPALVLWHCGTFAEGLDAFISRKIQ